MKSDMLIFFVALVILGGAFAGYLNWLIAQPRLGMVQVKVLSPHVPPKPEESKTIAAPPALSTLPAPALG